VRGKRPPPTDKDQAFYVALGQRIRALRDEKRLSLEAVAERVGIKPRRLANLEAGLVVAGFPLEKVTAIAEALGVKTFDLFNVEHASDEVAGLVEELRGQAPEKVQAARGALEAEGGASGSGESGKL
jgi:transcriptional regulator with XRE-family HTH domain